MSLIGFSFETATSRTFRGSVLEARTVSVVSSSQDSLLDLERPLRFSH